VPSLQLANLCMPLVGDTELHGRPFKTLLTVERGHGWKGVMLMGAERRRLL
jgi:hypothetical protein